MSIAAPKLTRYNTIPFGAAIESRSSLALDAVSLVNNHAIVRGCALGVAISLGASTVFSDRVAITNTLFALLLREQRGQCGA